MLLTERLKLRPFLESDKDTVVILLKNADFMAYSPTGVMNQFQAESRFELLYTLLKITVSVN